MNNLLSESFPSYQIFLIRFTDVASLPEKSCPKLNTDDSKYEENKEAEKQDIAKHRKSVQQQHHKYPHAWNSVYCSERPKYSNSSYRWEVQFLCITKNF